MCRYTGFEVFSTEENAMIARKVLEKMLQLGSDINKLDSSGNSGIWRYCLQANQILPRFNYATNCECNDRIFTVELENDLLSILRLLCKYGADLSYASPNVLSQLIADVAGKRNDGGIVGFSAAIDGGTAVQVGDVGGVHHHVAVEDRSVKTGTNSQ